MTRQVSNPARVLVVVAVMVMAVLLLASTVQAANGTSVVEGEPMVEYTVRHGDNLWTIAEAATPDGEDVRSTIEAIRSLNELAGSTIYSGQVLAIPER